MTPRLARLAAAAIVVAATLSPHTTAERMAACTAPAKTLTFKCDNACGASIPCLANTTAVGGAASCSIKCLDKVYAIENSFTIHTAFGSWKSAQQLAEPPSSLPTTKAPTETGKRQTENNDNLEAMEPLELPSNVTDVILIGRSPYLNGVKGRVSNVKFAPGLLAKSPSVTSLDLTNFNLEPQATDIASLLPANVVNVSLTNNLLTAIPPALGDLKALRSLKFSLNYVASVNSTSGMDDTLTELIIAENNITSFTAVFPKLETLDLADNKLQEIPAVLATYPALKTLSLLRNKLTAVPSSVVLPSSITTLRLSSNNIASFEALIPSLSLLSLTNNSLTAVPLVLFNHTKLATLYLDGNPMKDVTFTSAQFSFLAGLNSFTISNSSLRKDCPGGELKSLRSLVVCVVSTDTNASDGKNDDSGGSSVGLILGIVGGVVVLVAIIIAVVCVRSRKKAAHAKAMYTNADGTLMTKNPTNGTGTMSLWDDEALLAVKVDEEDIEDIKKIGKGAFGDVWLVKYRKTQLLASKRLRKSGISPTQTQNFIDEIKLVAKLEHPNIVAFVGAAWTIQSDLQALFEFMDGGDLRDYLTNKQTPRTWTPEKLQIAIDIAEALVYVHSFAPPLVHRDLKSRNVLLGSSGSADNDGSRDGTLHAKLTDFGVSRFRSEDNTMTSGVGTGKWLAPEVITGATDYGAPADIFSFGAVLTEIDTHALPYDDVVGPNGAKLADVALLQLVASGEARPQFSSKCPAEIAELGERCFALDSTARPVAAEIAYALRQLKKRTHKVL